MTYAELKAQIRDLGFSDDDEIEEFEEVVPHAINLAIAEINQIVGSVVGTHEVELDGTKTLTVVDMEEAEGYLELTETPAILEKNGEGVFEVFNDFDTREDGRLLFIKSAGVKGKLKIYYKKQAQQYTVETDDDTQIDLGRKYHPLIPLLASYYVWLEDDQTKATMYYNRYETMIQSMLNANPPRVRVLTGGV